jgi:hypothetical protein
MWKAAFLTTTVVALDDLQRSRTKVPGDAFRAHDHPYSVASMLSSHLERVHKNTKPCNQFTAAELQELQTVLHAHHQELHNDIYSEVSDTRSLRFSSLAGYQAHWDEMNVHAATHPNIHAMQRDGHCLETVMWWTHHLSEVSRKELSQLTIPRMPHNYWREPTDEEGESASQVYLKGYNPSSTCLACHGGGVEWQNPENEPPPFPRQVNGKDRARRCDEYFGEDVGECNACEGMAGFYWGDMPDFTDPIACEVVGTPDDIPLAERMPTSFPSMGADGKFAVEMRGSDRWPRASPSGDAACDFTTDCSPYNKSQEGQPNPPTVWGHWYAGIHGALYLDHSANDTQYGGGLLRHETVYEFPGGEEGRDRSARGEFSENNMHLTEMHIQTQEMADVSDPGVMLNLVHMNWTDGFRGRTFVDENSLDWRRLPTPPHNTPVDTLGGDALCVCVPDPAGIPWFDGAYNNATYKGRVKFVVPWQQPGSFGPPSTVPIVADHYVKWTFHLFVNVETKRPALFSSPFGGIASYGNWSNPDELWPESYNGGWRTLPERQTCFDPTGASETCKAYIPPALMTV